jgi:CHAD domain-containing protein
MISMREKRTALINSSVRPNQARDGKNYRNELPMDSAKHLTASLKTQWKRYRKRLKRCQEEFSEEAVHDSRVETRRLLSIVELLGAFIRDGRIKKARRALKRHLDAFDDLRDTHVQLLYVGKMLRAFPAVRPFHAYLLKREGRFTTETRKRIKRIKTKRLGQLIARCKEELRQQHKRRSPKQALTLLLRTVNGVFRRVSRFQERIDPDNTVTIHRLRIAFKKFRYMSEALADILPGVTAKQLATMQHYQAMMGDIQDMEVLLATLDKFLKKKGIKPQSIRSFRDELLRRRQWLIQRFMHTTDKLHEFEPQPDFAGDSAHTRKRGNV